MNKLLATALSGMLVASAQALVIHEYDASIGNPATTNEVQDPILDQGWSANDGTLGSNDVQEAVFEGGKAAWRNFDSADNNNPGYVYTLSTADYQDMFDAGWIFTVRARLEQGAHFISWGGDQTNTGGNFDFPGDRRTPVPFNASGDDYTINFPGNTVTVTNGILSEIYVRIVMEGSAGNASNYTVSVFNDDTGAVIAAPFTEEFAAGNTSTDNNIGWQSGSATGDNREAIFREVSLKTIAEPEIKPFEYDAGLGTSPETQGWNHSEILEGAIDAIGVTNNMEAGHTDGSDTVLYMKDQNTTGAYDLPAFWKNRQRVMDQALWNYGTRLTIVGKNLGGWFIGYGFNGSVYEDADNIGADKRIGFNLTGIPNDGAYHTIVIEGVQEGVSPGVTNYNFTVSIDGGATTPLSIQNNSAPGEYDQAVYFSSGSSGGTSAEAMFKSIVLETISGPPTATPVEDLVITGPVSAGTAVELSWTGESGFSYNVETNSNLVDGEWNAWTSNIPGVDGLITVTNTIGPDQTFYRVITEE